MLAYHRARWMDARVGRFEGMDPLDHEGVNRTIAHPYAYVSDSPVSGLDPTGQDDLESIGAAVDIVSVFATLATPSTAFAATGSGWASVTNFDVSQGPQSPNDQFVNAIFHLSMIGMPSDVVIGQKATGEYSQPGDHHSEHVTDDPSPGALWWDGANWSAGTQGSKTNEWTGAPFNTQVTFYDKPGWLIPLPVNRSFHYNFRTYVALKSQPTYRLAFTDWEILVEYHPGANTTTHSFWLSPFIED